MSKSEKSIEKKHAALYAEKQRRKKADPTCEFGDVIELMRRTADELEALPEDTAFDLQALDSLEDARHEAIRLKMEIEAIFESLQGS